MDKPQFTFPRYPSIISTGLAVIASRMLGHKRSLRSDALRMTGRIFPPINVEGIENIPAHHVSNHGGVVFKKRFLGFEKYYRNGDDNWRWYQKAYPRIFKATE